MEAQVDDVHANRLDRVGEIDLRTGDGEAVGAQRLGDVARGHRAVELAGLAGLPDDDDRLAVEAGGNAGGGLAALLIALFDRGAFLLELGAVGFGGAQGLLLRQQIIAGEPVLDGDLVADMAQTADALEQNDFHLGSPCCPAGVAVRGAGPSGAPTTSPSSPRQRPGSGLRSPLDSGSPE